MYKVGQILGYAVHPSDEHEKAVRLIITDVVFSEFDDNLIEKYLVDFRDDETERQLDSLYWYPHIYKTSREFIKSAGYYLKANYTEKSKEIVENQLPIVVGL